MLLSLVLAVVFGVLAVFFANDNQGVIQLQLLGLRLAGKLGIAIVIAFGLGALTGLLVMLPSYLSQVWALLRTRRKLEDLQRELRMSQSGGTKEV